MSSSRAASGAADGILAFILWTPEVEDRVAVVTDLIAYVRERRERPGPEGVEMLAALERRLEREMAAGCGAVRAGVDPV
jgi:hypothetical protein